MKESVRMKDIQIALAELGYRLFRNNVGTLQNLRGEYVTYGLCEGSSDLVGWVSIEVTPEMLGKKIAVFVACEVKQPGKKPTDKQAAFLSAIRSAGGIAVVATSVEEAIDAVQRQR